MDNFSKTIAKQTEAEERITGGKLEVETDQTSSRVTVTFTSLDSFSIDSLNRDGALYVRSEEIDKVVVSQTSRRVYRPKWYLNHKRIMNHEER